MARAFATAAFVRSIAPEFAGATDEQIDPYLRRARNAVSLARYGDQLDDAHALWTAHLMKMDPNLTGALGVASGSTGVVASESHGPASVSYANAAPSSMSEAWISGSSYGQEFKIIRDRMRGRGSAVRVGNGWPQRS